MKKFILGALCLSAFAAQAQNAPFPSSNLKVKANAIAGCDISAQNVSFGDISEANRKSYTTLTIKVPELAFESELVVKVKCSNKKSYDLKGMPMLNSPEFPGRYGRFMTGANKKKVLQYGLWMKEGAKVGSWFSTGAYFGGFSSGYISSIGNGEEQTHKIFVGLYSITSNNGKNYFELVPDTYSENYTLTVSY